MLVFSGLVCERFSHPKSSSDQRLRSVFRSWMKVAACRQEFSLANKWTTNRTHTYSIVRLTWNDQLAWSIGNILAGKTVAQVSTKDQLPYSNGNNLFTCCTYCGDYWMHFIRSWALTTGPYLIRIRLNMAKTEFDPRTRFSLERDWFVPNTVSIGLQTAER